MPQRVLGYNVFMVFRFRALMLGLIVGLVLSGVTAFPLLWELNLLAEWFADAGGSKPGSDHWFVIVRDGLEDTYTRYPWIGYGTDWLAFGHLVIALFFIDPLVRPTRDHQATLWCGIVACVGVIPLALIAGAVREIPWSWRLIDMSFGVVGLIPLVWGLRLNRRILKVH